MLLFLYHMVIANPLTLHVLIFEPAHVLVQIVPLPHVAQALVQGTKIMHAAIVHHIGAMFVVVVIGCCFCCCFFVVVVFFDVVLVFLFWGSLKGSLKGSLQESLEVL